MLLAASVAAAVLVWAAAPAAQNDASSHSGSTDDSLYIPQTPDKLPYDTEYPVMHYERKPVDNDIARLQARLDRGEVKLQFTAPRGYLDSLLKALDIDPSSQTLVYSRTSLQVGAITAATPRAIYFNDETYVGWVQGSTLLELGAMDRTLGQVFYTINNSRDTPVRPVREIRRCLSCHDTYSLSGGGVPRFLLMSSYVNTHGDQLTHEGLILTTDQTPLKYRWGGWYVTGQSGKQVHLGNILIHSAQQLVHLDNVRHGNIDNLDALFNTKPYLTDKSDIVALMILQHQETVQNLITRVNFEVRNAQAREPGHLSEKTEEKLKGYMDSLVQAMLFVNAADITGKISGNSGFAAWFQARGPRDRQGRSLRQLDLTTRLFKYPLSYLVYSSGFDGLPDYAKNYIYGQFADVLSGHDQAGPVPQLTAADRKTLLEILTATKPAFANFMATRHAG